MLINVKMPTIVGILTFISMINTTSGSLKARKFFIFQYFCFYEQLEFCFQLIWAWTKFYKWLSLSPKTYESADEVLVRRKVRTKGHMLRTYATKYFPCWNMFNTLHTVCFMHELSIYEIKRICHHAYFFRISDWSFQYLTNFLKITLVQNIELNGCNLQPASFF